MRKKKIGKHSRTKLRVKDYFQQGREVRQCVELNKNFEPLEATSIGEEDLLHRGELHKAGVHGRLLR